MMQIKLTVNGNALRAEAEPYETLLTVLRREGFTGTKRVCESGECGACAVIVDGRAVDSCILLAAQCDGSSLTTIEGLEVDGRLTALQEAFCDNGAIQCGFCIPGMIVTGAALLEENPSPSENDVRHALVGNLCRCTGYVKPVEAVMAAIQMSRSESGA